MVASEASVSAKVDFNSSVVTAHAHVHWWWHVHFDVHWWWHVVWWRHVMSLNNCDSVVVLDLNEAITVVSSSSADCNADNNEENADETSN